MHFTLCKDTTIIWIYQIKLPWQGSNLQPWHPECHALPIALQGNVFAAVEGLEPPTNWLKTSRSTNCAIRQYNLCSLSDSNRHPIKDRFLKPARLSSYAKGAFVRMTRIGLARPFGHHLLTMARLPVTPHPLLCR